LGWLNGSSARAGAHAQVSGAGGCEMRLQLSPAAAAAGGLSGVV